MLQEAINAIAEFHRAKGIDYKQRLGDVRSAAPMRISVTLNAMRDVAELALERFRADGMRDLRLLRTHLILEEVGESLRAMWDCDEVELLDGLADSIVVINGTAVSFDLPLSEAYCEVCRSNMSKTKQATEDCRLREKGEAYTPPDIKGILYEHRRATMDMRAITREIGQ